MSRSPENYSLRDQLADYFKRHPGRWIDGAVLEGIAGKYAWRTRVSDCRTQLGMTIENRVRTVHREGCAKLFAADLEEEARCDCRRYSVSEYRYVPAPASQPSAGHDLNSPFSLR